MKIDRVLAMQYCTVLVSNIKVLLTHIRPFSKYKVVISGEEENIILGISVYDYNVNSGESHIDLRLRYLHDNSEYSMSLDTFFDSNSYAEDSEVHYMLLKLHKLFKAYEWLYKKVVQVYQQSYVNVHDELYYTVQNIYYTHDKWQCSFLSETGTTVYSPIHCLTFENLPEYV